MLYLFCDDMKRYKEYLKQYLLWIIALIGFIIFIVTIICIQTNHITLFDNTIYNIVKKVINPNVTKVFKVITEAGNIYVMFPIVFIILIFGKDKSFKKYFIYNLISVFLLNNILKIVFTRNRPIDINLIVETGYSFPSGHSMVSFAFYGFLAYYIYHTNLNKIHRYLLITMLGIIVFLIGLSRIYLGVHYASDVFGGFAISAAYLVLFIKYIYHKNKSAT